MSLIRWVEREELECIPSEAYGRPPLYQKVIRRILQQRVSEEVQDREMGLITKVYWRDVPVEREGI